MKKIIMILLIGIFMPINVNAESYTDKLTRDSSWISGVYIQKIQPDGTHNYQQGRILKRASDGHWVYCIQADVSIDEDAVYQGTDANVVSLTGMTKKEWERVMLLSYYGYNYNVNGYNHSASKWYSITQVMIWQTLYGPKGWTFYFSDTLKGDESVNKFASEIAEIENLIANHYKVPSFANSNKKLLLGETITLSDTNNVLKEFNLENNSNFDVVKNDNSLTITSKKITSASIIKLTKTSTRFNHAPIAYVAPDSQNFIMTGDYEPLESSLSIEVSGGLLKINKYGETVSYVENNINYDEIILPNVEFNIYSAETNLFYIKDELVTSIITNEDGYITLNNLPIGKYYLIETKTKENHLLNNEKVFFEISINKPEILMNINNYYMKGTLEFTKIDADTKEILSDALIEIYTENDELVFTSATDEHGKIIIENIPQGKYYLIEKKSPDGYEISDERLYFEITHDELTLVTMTNKMIIEEPPTIIVEEPKEEPPISIENDPIPVPETYNVPNTIAYNYSQHLISSIFILLGIVYITCVKFKKN